MPSSNSEEILRLLQNRGDVLEGLLADEMPIQVIDAWIGRSDRTTRRIVRDFEDHGLVVRDENVVTLTQFGRQLALAHHQYMDHVRTAKQSKELLVKLPGEAQIGCELMGGARTETYPDSDAAFDTVALSMRGADRIRGVAPTARGRYVDVFSEHIFDHRTEIELILGHDSIESLDEHYTGAWRDALDEPNCEIWPAESVPEYGLIIIDDAEVYLGVYDGELMGTIHNDSSAAVEWAVDIFDEQREQAGDAL